MKTTKTKLTTVEKIVDAALNAAAGAAKYGAFAVCVFILAGLYFQPGAAPFAWPLLAVGAALFVWFVWLDRANK